MATLNISDAERQRRSEAAKKMHQEVVVDPETGEERRKFGGKQPGSGRPPVGRVSASVVAEFQKEEEKKEIVAALKRALGDDMPAHVNLQAIRDIAAMEERERVIEREEQADAERRHRDEIVEGIVGRLEAMAQRKGIDLVQLITQLRARQVGQIAHGEEDERAA